MMLQRRQFFITSGRINYVSVGFYPSRDYQALLEVGNIRMAGSKFMVLKEEHMTHWRTVYPSICNGGTGADCVNGAF